MKYFAFVIILLGYIGFAQAASSGDVVINEIAWMGTTASYNDEWIELKNNTAQEINLDGWILKAADGTPEIKLARTVLASGFYLLERTDDNTVPGITADQIYTGALGNNGEKLELYDNFGNLIDSVDCSSGWLAGDNETKQTLERVNSLAAPGAANWQTSQDSRGTPKAKNSVSAAAEPPPPSEELSPQPEPEPQTEQETQSVEGQQQEESQPEPEPELSPQPRPEPQPEPKPITYLSGVIINELIPSPEGTDELEEWFELKNVNDVEVDISKWKIQDTIGSVTTYTFPEETKIGPKDFLVLSRPTTKITLNNSGDGLLLIQPNGNILDTVTYEKAPQGQSYNRTESGWAWSTVFTPGSTNITPTTPAKSETEKPVPQKELAAVSEPLRQVQNKQIFESFYVFLAAFVLAAFSGTVILLLKKKLKTGYNKNI